MTINSLRWKQEKTDNTNVNELSTHDYQQTPSITEGIHYTRWNLLQMDKYAYLKMHMSTLFCDGSSETYSVVEQRSNCEWEIPILIICRHTKLYMTTTAQHQIIQTTYKIQLTYTSLSNTCLYLMKHAPFLLSVVSVLILLLHWVTFTLKPKFKLKVLNQSVIWTLNSVLNEWFGLKPHFRANGIHYNEIADDACCLTCSTYILLYNNY